jgi:aconitate hydratase
MARGTFANVRLRNRLNPQIEGGITTYLPTGETMSIFDAAEKYQKDGTPLIIIAGTEYGTGSSRDWAAKGPLLQGVRAVIAESYERIHRSNLIGMGILPLQFHEGEDYQSLGLTGREVFSLSGLAAAVGSRAAEGKRVQVRAERAGDAGHIEFTVTARIDTPQEAEYYRHGGILQYVLRQLLSPATEG